MIATGSSEVMVAHNFTKVLSSYVKQDHLLISILTSNWRQGSSGDTGIALVEAAFPSGGWLLMRTPICVCAGRGWGE